MAGLSPVTSQWESLFSLYSTLGVVITIVVMSILFYNLIKYRSKASTETSPDTLRAGRLPADRGTMKATVVIIIMVAGILLPLSFGTIQTVGLIEHPPEEDALTIKVRAFQWGWRFVYPNGAEVVGELRVPRDTVVVFHVTSDDVFHNFGIYEYKVKIDAIPGMVNRIWIKPHVAGEYNILCYELCGIAHTLMKGKMIVLEPNEFQDWYSKLKPREAEHPAVQHGGNRP